MNKASKPSHVVTKASTKARRGAAVAGCETASGTSAARACRHLAGGRAPLPPPAAPAGAPPGRDSAPVGRLRLAVGRRPRNAGTSPTAGRASSVSGPRHRRSPPRNRRPRDIRANRQQRQRQESDQVTRTRAIRTSGRRHGPRAAAGSGTSRSATPSRRGRSTDPGRGRIDVDAHSLHARGGASASRRGKIDSRGYKVAEPRSRPPSRKINVTRASGTSCPDSRSAARPQVVRRVGADGRSTGAFLPNQMGSGPSTIIPTRYSPGLRGVPASARACSASSPIA
jgi:hypothetical protein